MAFSQSALSELLETFRTGEGVDLIRDSVRNGARPRPPATQAGDIELRIPKLRKGSFFPVILEPRRRIDQALYTVVMDAYVNGVHPQRR